MDPVRELALVTTVTVRSAHSSVTGVALERPGDASTPPMTGAALERPGDASTPPEEIVISVLRSKVLRRRPKGSIWLVHLQRTIRVRG